MTTRKTKATEQQERQQNNKKDRGNCKSEMRGFFAALWNDNKRAESGKSKGKIKAT